MLTPMVRVERVSKRYGSGTSAIQALADVSLEVPTGQFLCIMGPSGSGKSTLLHLIAGLDAPTTGRVILGERDLTQLSEDERSDLRLRRLGFVFQSFHLFPTFTIEENVTWPLEFLGRGRREARGRAGEELERVGLPRPAWSRRPAELSGGEQQRAAIARALAIDPLLLVADEPTGNLDARTGQVVLELLATLNRERRLTIVLVTHSTFAATYAARTVELWDGRIARDQPTAARPGSPAVASLDRPPIVRTLARVEK
jgi:putative ABC transport system ATP-binding protein